MFSNAARTTFALFALSLGSTLAFSAADDTINERQACMKAQGGGMGVFVPIMKGEKPYDAAAVTEAIGKMDAACANWNTFWSEESIKGGTVKHYAKPEILTDKAGFEAAGGAAYTAMQALKASTDEASFKAAFPNVGAGCKGCHDKFRLPKE